MHRWKTCVWADISLHFKSGICAGMHVLTQMVEVMLRTPRWYGEILVIFWSRCRSKTTNPGVAVGETHQTFPLSSKHFQQQADKMLLLRMSGKKAQWSSASLLGGGAPPSDQLVLVQRLWRLWTTRSDS